MEDGKRAFRKSLRPLLGNVIGVGIFGIPYVFAQAGFGAGVIALVVSGLMSTLAAVMYADMAVHTPGHARFVGLIRSHAGPWVGTLAAIGFFGSLLGAMAAYILIGGTFLHTLVAPFIGGSVHTFRVLFFVFAAIGVLGGTLAVAKLQRVFILIYVALIAFLVILAAPHIDLSHFSLVHGQHWLLPFGVTLFAFTGFGATPEMRDILGRNKHLLSKAIVVGMLLVGLLYLAFATAVVGVTGLATTQEALRGLSDLLGPFILLVGCGIGLCTILTAFLTHGLVVTNTWMYDFKMRYVYGWLLAVVPAFVIFLFGVKDFIRVIEVTGGVGIGLCGVSLVFAYEAMRRNPTTSKRMLAIPQPFVLLIGVMFIVSMLLPFIG